MKRLSLILMAVLSLTACNTFSTFSENPILAPTHTSAPNLSPQPATQTDSAAISPTPTVVPITEAPTPIPMLRFAIIGDFGTAGKPLEAVSQLINSWQPDFILTTGDNNYPFGEASTIDENIGQYFHPYISPYTGNYGEGAEINRFFPVLGNHDWVADNAQPYLDYFTLPGNERYYDFQWDFIHFFAIDSDWQEPDGNRVSSIQAEWLKQSLENSTATWKIVYMHHPPYVSGVREPMVVIRWPFQEWGADMVIAGHDHHYERLLINDFPYFVNGLGGGARYDVGELVFGSQITYRDDWGAMLVKATPFEIILEFINVNGELIDQYSIIR